MSSLFLGLICALAAATCYGIGPLVLASQFLDPKAPPAPMLSLGADWPARAGYALGCILLLIPAAAAEEIVFRGWLLRESAAISRNPVFLMAVNGVLFSAVHWDFAPDAFLTRALIGLDSYLKQLGTVTNWHRVFKECVERYGA